MLLTMSDKELNRVKIIQDTLDRRITREAAAKLLDISLRQVYRLILRFKQSGAEGLITLKRGKPSNHRKDESIRLAALNLIHANYSDFGPTLAHEKLTERHGLTLGVETLRQWMIADGLWVPHSRRRPRIYQPRHRRDCLGELVQIDGSHHDWFEGRAEKCCLLVFIDDATGRLLKLHFCETESAFDYINATRDYVVKHGKPIAFYSDRHTVFHVSKPDAHNAHGTQFGRVLSDLNIELICANSSQAKGRVERANLTLQDRLVKELRLNGINSIESPRDCRRLVFLRGLAHEQTTRIFKRST